MPGPCSNDWVCLLVRFSTLNKILRRKNITIDKLCGNPVLFIDAVLDESMIPAPHRAITKTDS